MTFNRLYNRRFDRENLINMRRQLQANIASLTRELQRATGIEIKYINREINRLKKIREGLKL